MIDRGSEQIGNQNKQEPNDLFLRRALTAYPVWEKDHNDLSRLMAKEMKKGQMWDFWKKTFVIPFNLTPVSFAGTAAILLCFVMGINLLISLINSPVQQMEFISQKTGRVSTPPWLWKMKISYGRRVCIPKDIRANLWLTDGSILQCLSDSAISLNFHKDRIITLDSGKIRIEAAPIPDSTMIVKTPLSDVRVTGTVFWVEIEN